MTDPPLKQHQHQGVKDRYDEREGRIGVEEFDLFGLDPLGSATLCR
ncbi:MAG: hypothetical protein ICV76_00840 [Nitrospiraceae bacterium]|nr:hypothetical protein [Nitrospiraceae bacterium]